MSPDERPDLRAVSEDEISDIELDPEEDVETQPETLTGEAPAVEPPRARDLGAGEREKSSRRGWLGVLLLLALAVVCLGYFYESRRAEALESRVSALQTELQEARQDLRAQEERMQVVRGYVDDLAGRVDLLKQAVAIDAE